MTYDDVICLTRKTFTMHKSTCYMYSAGTTDNMTNSITKQYGTAVESNLSLYFIESQKCDFPI